MRVPARIGAFATVLGSWAMLLGAARAQSDDAARALAAYRRVATRDEAQRQPAIERLGRCDNPEVTLVLLAELQRPSSPPFQRAVVHALGRHSRTGALPPLLAALDGAEKDFLLRNDAAEAVGRQGEAGVAALLQRLTKLPADAPTPQQQSVRTSLLRGLGAALPAAAARKTLEDTARDGDSRARLEALVELRDVDDGLTELRRDASKAPDLAIAAEAVRQLARHGDDGALEAAIAVHRRAQHTLDHRVHESLVEAFSRLLDDDGARSALLFHGAFVDATDRGMQRAAKRAHDDAAFAAWLGEHGASEGDPQARAVAIRLLADVPGAATTAMLAKLAGDDDDVAAAAILALSRRGGEDDRAALAKIAASRGPRRLLALAAEQPLRRADPTWAATLTSLLDEHDAATRVLALDLLAELGATDALPQAQKAFDDHTWTVRAAAYDFARKVRDASSVTPLIDRLDHEHGRLHEDVLDALEALTGLRLPDAKRWRSWWREHRDGFTLPPPPKAPAAAAADAGDTATTVSYWSLPVVSDRCVFVVDTSSSMTAPFGTGHQTRLDEARRQLLRVLDQVDPRFEFDVVLFASNAQALFGALHRADRATVAKAREAANAATAVGNTNMHAALQAAFAEADVDTIYLLSDGRPSAGAIEDADALAETVQRWNRTRRVRIHTVAIGEDSPLLRRIAKESGGRFVLAK